MRSRESGGSKPSPYAQNKAYRFVILNEVKNLLPADHRNAAGG